MRSFVLIYTPVGHLDIALLKNLPILFLAVLGLRYCTWAFSSCSEWGCSLCGTLAFNCSGFSCCGARAIWCTVFSNCSMRARQLWLTGPRAWTQELCCTGLVTLWNFPACGVFPNQGSNPLAGRFLSTVPSGMLWTFSLYTAYLSLLIMSSGLAIILLICRNSLYILDTL